MEFYAFADKTSSVQRKYLRVGFRGTEATLRLLAVKFEDCRVHTKQWELTESDLIGGFIRTSLEEGEYEQIRAQIEATSALRLCVGRGYFG